MKPLLPAFLLPFTLLVACVPSDKAVNASPKPPLTAEEQAFVQEVQAIRARHGDAAARFVLADIGGAAAPKGFSQPVFECTYDDFGLLMGCDRVDEQ